MFLRQIINKSTLLTTNLRAFSNLSPMIDLTTDDDGISIMTLQKPPVNKLNLEMLKEISQALEDVERNKSKGLILTSSCPAVFTAGLDIKEFFKPDIKRAEEYWRTLQDVYFKLFGAKTVTAAAINGHAPAGGCLLSISTEYRVMVEGKYTIGLNETALGLIAPRWFMDAFCHTISTREAEYALTTARLFSVEEALKVGLIDEKASDKADAINKCKSFITTFDDIPSITRSMTKRRVREAVLNKFQERKEKDLQEFLDLLQHPEIQKQVEVQIRKINRISTK